MKRLDITPARRKSLLAYPLIVIPGLCLIFYSLGGGRGDRPMASSALFGLNPELPKASIQGRELLNKKLQYEQAERDSLRKAQYRLQDPYGHDSGTKTMPPAKASPGSRPPVPPAKQLIASDPRAGQVLAQLEQLRSVIRQPEQPERWHQGGSLPLPADGATHYTHTPPPAMPADTQGDARVGKLNEMLDKVIRIQHPEDHPATSPPVHTDEILPADPEANAITAIIADNVTLVAGSTVALRITDSVQVNGKVLPGGQLIYGTVSLSNSRMPLHITALRVERNLYTTDLQAYDLDGIAGIHIPGVLSRDVAKESADQGVGSLNVLNVDPSLGAQAAGAGIQMAKSFASRKVRQVRVSVPAGYRLLLRDAHARPTREVTPPITVLPPSINTPDFVPTGNAVSSCRNEGVELILRGVWLKNNLLWFGLQYSNRSAIVYTPAYTRWFIRDRRQLRRTAAQELPLEPASPPEAIRIAGDSTTYSWTAFSPFAISKDKELILEVGEKGGGRTLTLRIKHSVILDAKTIQP